MVLKHFERIWQSETIRKRILITLALVGVYKFLSILPVPGINIGALSAFQEYFRSQPGLAFFSGLLGGGLENFSIVLMGLAPYINATIIMQLLAVIVPKLEMIKKEGEQGQKKINIYTRYLTLPLALAQSYGMIYLMNTLLGGSAQIVDVTDFWGTMLPAMIIVTASTYFLLWLGDLITESGLGNGTSIIIFAGVLAGVPTTILGLINAGNFPLLLLLTALTIAVTYIIILFTEGYRKIPLIYTRTGREERSHFPIKVNQAGMVPIIFAVSLVTFPGLIGQFLVNRSGRANEIGQFLVEHFSLNNPSWIMIAVYFLLILGFSFFYVSIVFNTNEVAENIQKRGGYIPGVRPGVQTAEYLEKVSFRLNFWGGSFLALIAVFPYIITKANNYFGFVQTSGMQNGQIDFLITGAGLIIVVAVILDIIRRIGIELKSFDYKRFY